MSLHSLEFRRMRNDLIQTYMISKEPAEQMLICFHQWKSHIQEITTTRQGGSYLNPRCADISSLRGLWMPGMLCPCVVEGRLLHIFIMGIDKYLIDEQPQACQNYASEESRQSQIHNFGISINSEELRASQSARIIINGRAILVVWPTPAPMFLRLEVIRVQETAVVFKEELDGYLKGNKDKGNRKRVSKRTVLAWIQYTLRGLNGLLNFPSGINKVH